MSYPDCGVLNTRGWTGGLNLTAAVGSPTSSNSMPIKSTNADIPPSGSNGLAMSSSTPPTFNHSRRGRASPSPMNRTPLVRLSEERKAKRCRIYRNGDRWCPGTVVPISAERHRSWDALLADLTRLLEHPLHLVAGVRYIFSLDGSKIEGLDQLQDSGEYVASSTDTYKAIDYRAAQLPQWRLYTRRREALHVPNSPKSPVPNNLSQDTLDVNIRPRLVTVFGNGQRPRKAIRFLLNRKTARSLDQVMADLSTSLKLDTGAVRKVYSIHGRLMTCLKDLFQNDEVFIAYGQERFSREDFYLDNDESRSIQALLKSSSLYRKRMPSPKQRMRAGSPLGMAGHTGSLPRGSKLVLPADQMGYSSSEELFLPVAVSSKYSVGRVLGDGNFAIVRECKEIATKKLFALKIIDKSKCQGKEDMIQSEVNILKKVNHENIVRLEEDLHFPDYLYLVMELVTGGDLFDSIAAATRYTESEASHLICDLVSALEYLHQRNIVHRDVKPENLLVVPGPMQRLKLGDFGLAVELTEPLYTICGTPTYVAPEILSEQGYGLEVDIWAAGVIAYILLCGFPPFISQTNDQEELFEQILSGVINYPSPYWDHVSESPRELISAMILVCPEERLTAEQVLGHPWITGNDEEYSPNCNDYNYADYEGTDAAELDHQHNQLSSLIASNCSLGADSEYSIGGHTSSSTNGNKRSASYIKKKAVDYEESASEKDQSVSEVVDTSQNGVTDL